MAPERASGFLQHLRGLRRPGEHVSPTAAVALFVSTGMVWLLTTRPAAALQVWKLGPHAPLTLDESLVLASATAGAFALLAGLFAIGVYVLHWPAIQNRETRQMIVQARAELAELQIAQARLSERVASLRRMRAEIATYEAQLMHAHAEDAQAAGRAFESGLELVDDIISELQSVGAHAG